MYEEFSWVLGQAEDLPLAILHSDVGQGQVLAGLLGVDVRAVRYIFVPDGLDFRLLVHFSRGFKVSFDTQIMGAMMCCFATLLFVTGNLIVDANVVFIVRQALGECLIAPVVLAETLNGLDIVSVIEGEFFQGAPILLYM